MFDKLGVAISRFWPLALGIWIGGLIAVQALAPHFDEVAEGGEFNFLPDDAPSRRGEDLFHRAFPDHLQSSNVVVVLYRDGEHASLQDADRDFISETLVPGLEGIAEAEGGLASNTNAKSAQSPAQPSDRRRQSSIISGIRTYKDRGIGALLESADENASLVVVELTTDLFEVQNGETVRKIEHLLSDLQSKKQVPPGLNLSLTGSATVGRDMRLAEHASAHAAKFWTITLVIVLLAVIYRAPLLALVPLVTLYISVEIAARVLALLAQSGLIKIFQGLEVYMTVVAYGAGVDYCLFLIARCKEGLLQGDDPPRAIAHAIGRVGAALTASAGTVICGIAMLTFAEFGKFHEAGIGMSFGLFVVFCAVMTFTPALVRLAGHWAFWPAKLTPVSTGFSALGDRSAASGMSQRHWHHHVWSNISYTLERKPGLILILSIAVLLPLAITGARTYAQVSYGLIDQLPSSAPSVMGTHALEEHFPVGITGPVTLLLTNRDVDFSSREGANEVRELVDRLSARKQKLRIADIRSVASPLGITSEAERPFHGISGTSLAIARADLLRRAKEIYVSSAPGLKDQVTRLELILESDPFAGSSILELDDVDDAIRAELPDHLRQHTEVALAGPTASVRDLKSVEDHDRILIYSLVLGVVFCILVVLLGKIVISLYLILTVLFSYFATLGATYSVFWVLDPQGFAGLDWTVPIFLFTLLVAVGEDYNIFLMTRVHEEQMIHGPTHGVAVALARTGGIITSCGVIMAGTFASLTTGSLARMIELGFALAFGVLLDTFIVRPILVPTFLLLLENGFFGSVGKYLGARGTHARI